ncbi:MAG: helix-turn-helix domain-containing protein [Clostridiales bacterium]|nr:helix-turn-helix domain-containing protein [Clostridiales bacterium]
MGEELIFKDLGFSVSQDSIVPSASLGTPSRKAMYLRSPTDSFHLLWSRSFVRSSLAKRTRPEVALSIRWTIQSFFENNLNGSETSRKLFVHRNTLVYRLDKVQKITGLDLRSFDDAVLFKLAAMVRAYLEKVEKNGEGGNLNW